MAASSSSSPKSSVPSEDPLVEGDDHRVFGVAAVDQLEEAAGILVCKRRVANLVADEKLWALVVGELPPKLAEPVCLA
jgi:hypothetical protein